MQQLLSAVMNVTGAILYTNGGCHYFPSHPRQKLSYLPSPSMIKWLQIPWSGLEPYFNLRVTNWNCSILLLLLLLLLWWQQQQQVRSELLFLSPPAHSLVTILTVLSQLHHRKIGTKNLNKLWEWTACLVGSNYYCTEWCKKELTRHLIVIVLKMWKWEVKWQLNSYLVGDRTSKQ